MHLRNTATQKAHIQKVQVSHGRNTTRDLKNVLIKSKSGHFDLLPPTEDIHIEFISGSKLVIGVNVRVVFSRSCSKSRVYCAFHSVSWDRLQPSLNPDLDMWLILWLNIGASCN